MDHSPTYLDIGAYDPFVLSNTALLYESGSMGINIEPNPIQFRKIARHRKRDINLNIGIGAQEGQLNYYEMSVAVLNTFSEEQALDYVKNWGYRIVDVFPVAVKSLAWVLESFCPDGFPDLLSLDVEGQEMEILQGLLNVKSRPKVICVETLTFTNDLSGRKRPEISALLTELGYSTYADTHLNTILLRNDIV
jgi:FkbM family methyltransferase